MDIYGYPLNPWITKDIHGYQWKLLLFLDGLLLLFLGRLSERAIEQPISYKTLPIDGLVGYRETNRIPQGHPLHAQCFRQIPPVL